MGGYRQIGSHSGLKFGSRYVYFGYERNLVVPVLFFQSGRSVNRNSYVSRPIYPFHGVKNSYTVSSSKNGLIEVSRSVIICAGFYAGCI